MRNDDLPTAEELAESWVNGNRTHVADTLLSLDSSARLASLTIDLAVAIIDWQQANDLPALSDLLDARPLPKAKEARR